MLIAKPFEVGAAGTYVTGLVSEYGFGVERASEGMGMGVMKSALPIDGAAIVGGPLRAIGETMSNYDAFRERPIIPQGEAKEDIQYRHTERGSRLGRGLQALTGDNVDARNVDHVVQGFFGSTGQQVESLSDIGRGDEGKGPGLNLTGAFSDAPVAHARDVEWLMEHFTTHGLENAPPIKRLKEKLNAYYGEHDPEMRKELGAQVRELAKSLREEWDEEAIEELRAQKDSPVDAQ